MSSFWRNAGLTYIRYSNVCARAVRDALKADYKTESLKRAEPSMIKAVKYENGKPVGKDGQYLGY